ncbi:uncharacterized protein METZ01_LOCUS264410 [marine metagenome]|uniref:Uncharacterized protein n=1 Tax=marine metagenome TaxID=408172 RepID=A0A382JI87_9ZZZZ
MGMAIRQTIILNNKHAGEATLPAFLIRTFQNSHQKNSFVPIF